MDIWQSITKTPTPDSSIAASQKIWSHPLQVIFSPCIRFIHDVLHVNIYLHLHSHFIAAEAVLSVAQTQASRARLIAAAAPSSGAFLQAIPMSLVGTRLDNTSMCIAVSLRLGAPLSTPHDCICGMAVDSSGVHGLSCRKSAGREARHTAMNSIVMAALSSAEIPIRLEHRGRSRDDGKRPDGVTSMPWKNGRCLIWDVTYIQIHWQQDMSTKLSRVLVSWRLKRKQQSDINIHLLITQRTFSNQFLILLKL